MDRIESQRVGENALRSGNTIKSNTVLSLFAALLAGLLLVAHPAAAQPDAQGAEAFVSALEEHSLKYLTDKTIPREARARRVREVMERDYDLEAIGRFSLGAYWRSASDAQRQEYQRLLKETMVVQYTKRMEGFAGMTITPVTVAPVGERDFIVRREVRHSDGMICGMEWRVRAQGDSYKVVDLTVMGISMGVTQRGEFAEIIQRGGGRIDALLHAMRKNGKATILAQNH